MSYPVITQQPADVTLHIGEEYYAEFTVAATCAVTPTYSWEVKDPGYNVWSVLYWTNPTLRYGTDSIWSSGTKFRCKVTGGGGDFIYSDEATLTVEGPVNLIPLLPNNDLETYNAIYAVGNTGEYEGVSYTVNSDGSITLNGTCTHESGYSVYLYIISNVSSLYVEEKPRFWLSEGDYVLDLHAPSEGIYANLWAYTKSGGGSYIVSHHRGENGPVSFHFDGDDDTLTGEITLNFEFKGGTTFNNFTFRPMLEYGTVGHAYAKPSRLSGYITYQPQNVVANPGDTVTFSVGYAGYEPTFLWACREADVSGEGFSGVDTDKLTVVVPDNLTSYTLACSINSSHSTDRFSSSAKLAMGIEINTTNFPDPLFRNYVSTFDLDEDGWLSKSEIQKVTFFYPPQLDVGSMTSLKGLEYFTELTEIDMFANTSQIPQDRAQITSIDLSRCTKLKVLYIHHINLLTINLSNNVDLERISIQNCSISDIDLSHNLKVWDLVLWYNSNLDSIDVTMLEELKRFQIRSNFTTIDISHNRKLYLLDVIENRSMTSVDISCNPDLCIIYSYKSGVKVWDFTGHRSLYNASQKAPQVITFSGGFKAWDFEGPNLGDLDPELGDVSIECDIGTTFIDNGIVVVSQPTDVTVSDGENYSFIFQVSGSNLTYVWQKRANKNSPWITLNETTNTYSGTASSNDDGYEFRCIASDNTASKESNIVTLSVLHSPEILSNPEAKNVLEGSQATFSVTASGGDLRYQWQVSLDSGLTWNEIRYATDQDYTFVAALSMNAYRYRCLVSNDIGTAESNAAILTVTADQSLTPPTITTHPSSLEITEGNNATFSIVASGNNLSYQWQTLKNGTWYNINGANSDFYTTLASRSLNGNRYRCQVSNAAGGVYSNTATLTVTSSAGSISTPTISTQPRSANVNDGQTAIFSLMANGGGLSYQWYIKRNGQWYPISGAANAIYSVIGRSANNGTQYRCLVTNSAGSVYSNVVTLSVQSAAPLSFYGYHSIIISGKNTYGEWEMYPTSRPHVAPPEVKTSYVDVPGADGGLDYTDLLTGEPRFGYRKGSWEFLLIPQERWPDVYRSLCNFLNGRVHTVVLEDDPTWQYTGRLSVNKWESAAHNSLITIDYILDPNPVNLDDESYSTDDDDLAAAARILRKPGNEGMVIGMFNGSATVVDPATYFEDGDNISY